jgi:hypothetical protein
MNETIPTPPFDAAQNLPAQPIQQEIDGQIFMVYPDTNSSLTRISEIQEMQGEKPSGVVNIDSINTLSGGEPGRSYELVVEQGQVTAVNIVTNHYDQDGQLVVDRQPHPVPPTDASGEEKQQFIDDCFTTPGMPAGGLPGPDQIDMYERQIVENRFHGENDQAETIWQEEQPAAD